MIIPPTTGIGVAISDGPGNTATACAQVAPVGEWSLLDVAQGTTFGAPFPVTLHILTSSLPAGFTLASVKVCHDLGGGATETISAPCPTGTPTTAMRLREPQPRDARPMLLRRGFGSRSGTTTIARKASGYLEIVVWLNHNGYIRGGY